MKTRTSGWVLGGAAVAMGLVAGFFFDWAATIMPALERSDDRTYVVVMQQTTAAINGGALVPLVLAAALVLSGVAAILQYRVGARSAVRWILAALGLYVVALAVTVGIHFPLNDTLVNAGDPDAIANLAALRESTESAWVNAHLVRTVAVILALAALCRALWKRPEPQRA
ncbi:anthrone oxygenase family protein [Tenggerimyces flavus]|uniref:DUF1772 domain-containing protein n=1 Tax=Tenggerimyces flavus TaxID=1708749 RepID=A0ABV7YIA3_9ACTN|nr:DUF1772 domain-containing protein [Tenggerimyces flavus]MBM7786830.1 putative membrane protein [Tenggerimyces flavus]